LKKNLNVVFFLLAMPALANLLSSRNSARRKFRRIAAQEFIPLSRRTTLSVPFSLGRASSRSSSSPFQTSLKLNSPNSAICQRVQMETFDQLLIHGTPPFQVVSSSKKAKQTVENLFKKSEYCYKFVADRKSILIIALKLMKKCLV